MATRSLIGGLILAILLVGLSGGVAYAHGGIAGPDELGPPVITSAVLGILCYWVVVLWPSRSRRDLEKKHNAMGRAAR
jgi:hypothetical protein